MILASMQPEVDKVVARSDKAILTLKTSKCKTAWTVQKCPGNPTSPLMENECSAIPFRFCWVSDMTGSTPLPSMSESSANGCPAVSASFVIWAARPGDGTLRTVVRSTSRLCVACLNMQLQPGHLGCQLPQAANLKKSSWRQRVHSPAAAALPQLKQSSRDPNCPIFQQVS